MQTEATRELRMRDLVARSGVPRTTIHFYRRQGLYMADHFDPLGEPITHEEWEARRGEWLPTRPRPSGGS